MSEARSWVLTDVDRSIWLESLALGPEALGVPDSRVTKGVLRGGLRDGVEILDIENGSLSFSVVPTRGMGLWKGDYRGTALGWEAPVKGPVHPKFVNLHDRGGTGWLSGFDEWICRCGLESIGIPGKDVVPDYAGNPMDVDLTLHGKVANLPAHYVEVQADPEAKSVSVIGHVDETALFSPGLRMRTAITTTSQSNRLTIADEFVNLKSSPAELQILYHMNFGAPLLEEGSRLLVPAAEVAPFDAHSARGIDDAAVYQGPTLGFIEQVYYYDLVADDTNRTLAALQNAAGDKAVVVRFDKGQLLCFTQWKNTAPMTDGYVTALEPGTNYPNLKTQEREKGRVIRLDPGASYRCELEVEICHGLDTVRALRDEVAALRGKRSPVIHGVPVPKYS